MSDLGDKMWRKIEEDLFRETIFSGTSTTNSETLTAARLREMMDGLLKTARPKPKVFPPQVHTAAKIPYFHDWVATRLGLTRDEAKAITYQRLYGTPPYEIARIIAAKTSLPEVKASCEDYLHNLKGL